MANNLVATTRIDEALEQTTATIATVDIGGDVHAAKVVATDVAGTALALALDTTLQDILTALSDGTQEVVVNAGAVDATIAGLLLAQAAATAGQTGPMVQGAVTDTPPAYGDGTVAPFSLTQAGSVRVAITEGAAAGGTSIDDEDAFTPGSTPITPMGAVFQATPDSVADGQVGAPRMTADRRLLAQFLTPNGDSPWDDTDDALRVAFAQSLDLANDHVRVAGETAHGEAATERPVRIAGFGSATAPTNVDANDTANWWMDLAGRGRTTVIGEVAHDDPVSGANPLLQGFGALAHGANPTAVAATDLVRAIADRHGIPWVQVGHPHIISKEFHITAAKTDIDLLGAVATGTKIKVHSCTAVVSDTVSVAVGVRIGFGTATIPGTADAGTGAAGIVLSHPGLKAESGGGIIEAKVPVTGGDGEELRITSTVPTGGALRVLVKYNTIES